MGDIIQLKDKTTNSAAYPRTITSAIVDNTGDSLDNILQHKADVSDLSNIKAEEVISSPLLEEINVLTREEIKKDLFIDLWNEACGSYGTYNANTGYFELNGLTDISYDEAIAIYNKAQYFPYPKIIDYSGIRTNLFATAVETSATWDRTPVCDMLYRGDSLKVIRVSQASKASNDINASDHFKVILPKSAYNMFTNVCNCVEVLGTIDIRHIINQDLIWFYHWQSNIVKLEKIWIRRLRTNLTLYGPNLKAECIRYIIENRWNETNTTQNKVYTLKLDSAVYNKIIDTTNQEYHSLLELATNNNIIIASI